MGDRIRLIHILEAISDIDEFLLNVSYDEFLKDKMRFQATLRELEIIGEASNRVSKEIMEKYSEISWLKMIGLRNLVIHEYFGVDSKTIWNIIAKDIPKLEESITILLEKEF